MKRLYSSMVWAYRWAMALLFPTPRKVIGPRDWLSFLDANFVPIRTTVAKQGNPMAIPDVGGRDPTRP